MNWTKTLSDIGQYQPTNISIRLQCLFDQTFSFFIMYCILQHSVTCELRQGLTFYFSQRGMQRHTRTHRYAQLVMWMEKVDFIMCKHIGAYECVTYSVCDHFHPHVLLLWSVHVIRVKAEINEPVARTQT